MDIDMEGALEALTADMDVVDDNPVVEAPVDSADGVEASAVADAVVPDAGEDNLDGGSFTGLDPSVLPEDLQAVYKSMQADYTRKTQEIAEARKQFEAFSNNGIDPNAALEAVGFIQRLDTDPAFQMQVLNHLSSLHEQPKTGQPSVEESVPNSNQGDYSNLPPEIQQELEEMRQFRTSFAEQQEQFQMEQELELEESQIREAYPHYNDSDIENIYNLAFATEGDLLAAQQMYHSMEQNMLNKYLKSKQVPAGATSPSGGPVSVPPREFSSLDEAHKAAMERLRNLQ